MKIKIPWLQDYFIDEKYRVYIGNNNISDISESYIELPDRENIVRKFFKKFLYYFVLFDYPIYVNFQDVQFYELPYSRRDNLINMHAVFTKPYEIYPGFRLCAVRPTVAASSDGQICSAKTGHLRKLSITDTGYKVISLRNPISSKIETFKVHRLIANAWVYKDQDSSHIEVNHKDGDRQNNCASNLEWCTHCFNMKAILGQHEPGEVSALCEVRDSQTGKVYQFVSVIEAAKFMGIDDKLVSSSALTKLNPLFNNRYEFRYREKARDWFYTDDMEIVSSEAARYVFIVTIPNRDKRLVFNGQQSFRSYFGIYKINGVHTSNNRLLAKAFAKKYPNYRLEIVDRIPSYQISVKNIVTGEVKDYQTASSAAKDLNTFPNVITRIASFEGKKQWRNYQIRHTTSGEWPEIESRSEHTYSLILIDSDDNIREFSSRQKVADYLKCSRAAVTLALNRGFFIDKPYRISSIDKYSPADVKSRNKAGTSYRVKPRKIRTED